MKDIKSTIIKIKKIAKLNNKISCVFLGTTVQKEKASFYITPIRENKKFVFCSVILFSDHMAEKIVKIIDGHIPECYFPQVQLNLFICDLYEK